MLRHRPGTSKNGSRPGGAQVCTLHRTIVVGGDVAYAYGLQHMTGTKVDGENADLWFRTTACFRRKGERWLITHMHNSVPFAMDGTDKALVDLKPQS